MRVVHLWHSPTARGGGGGVMMGRLHDQLLRLGHESAMLCLDPTAGGTNIYRLRRWRYPEGALRRVLRSVGLNDIHRLSSWQVPRHEIFRRADVVHLHGLHSAFLSYMALPALTKVKPTVFTMHDMWALTGHCSQYFDCERWRTGCGRCPYPDTHPAVRRDATAVEWRLKRRAYARSRMSVVAVSKPQLVAAREGLLRSFPLTYIPNGVDTTVFRPRPRAPLRKELGIPPDRRVLMFASIRLADPIKGLEALLEALARLDRSARERLCLLLVGEGSPPSAPAGVQIVHRGFLADPEDLAKAYAAAELFVSPTKAEAQGQVLLEAMAAGAPPVAFAALGVTDVVRHEETGLLVPTGDVAALSAGIARLLSDSELRGRLATRGRRVVEQVFSLDLQVQRYVELYEKTRQAFQQRWIGDLPRAGTAPTGD
jgi:glycosyltransferase involved in cell wall biosynthesis